MPTAGTPETAPKRDLVSICRRHMGLWANSALTLHRPKIAVAATAGRAKAFRADCDAAPAPGFIDANQLYCPSTVPFFLCSEITPGDLP